MNTVKKSLAFTLSLLMLTVSGCGESESVQETPENDIRVYTSYFSARGNEIAPDNEIQQLIAEKTGAMCKETWADNVENIENDINDMLVSNSYPDFIETDSSGYQKLLEADAFIPIDSYWDSYPNIKNFYSESEWNRVRADDGHVYIIPLFSSCYLHDTNTLHNDEAFWVQVRVLEWAGYPEVNTLDDYFNLLEGYIEANPLDSDGEPYIGYEILANDTFFFSLDNPPMFLDGYPNDGCCIVDPETLEAKDYNLSPTAEKWFRKLNEEYEKGIVDPDCFLMNTDQYYEKIKSGKVLGMVDQNWNFNSAAHDLTAECTYIPLGITIDEGITDHYHSIAAFNESSGLSVTKSCTDVDGALQFLNDLLSPEILNLRFWGIEGVDYMVGDGGVFYQTDEQFRQWRDADYAKQHICLYNYFPYYFGMNQDGINAYCSSYQPDEFYKTLNDDVKKCFDAYGVKTYVEMLDEAPEENPAWFPMWTYILDDSTEAGRVMNKIDTLKHKYLPQLVMADDFESKWQEYNDEYAETDSQVYFDALTAEVKRRSGY